jgi:hypothetical protein
MANRPMGTASYSVPCNRRDASRYHCASACFESFGLEEAACGGLANEGTDEAGGVGTGKVTLIVVNVYL